MERIIWVGSYEFMGFILPIQSALTLKATNNKEYLVKCWKELEWI